MTVVDQGYAVLRRTSTSGGAYLLYNVNLGTGSITSGALVGGGAGADFTGGFAVSPFIPAPGALGALATAAVVLGARRRRCH